MGLPDTGAESFNTEKKQIPLVLGRADQLVYEDRTSQEKISRNHWQTLISYNDIFLLRLQPGRNHNSRRFGACCQLGVRWAGYFKYVLGLWRFGSDTSEISDISCSIKIETVLHKNRKDAYSHQNFEYARGCIFQGKACCEVTLPHTWVSRFRNVPTHDTWEISDAGKTKNHRCSKSTPTYVISNERLAAVWTRLCDRLASVDSSNSWFKSLKTMLPTFTTCTSTNTKENISLVIKFKCCVTWHVTKHM